jgi:hypothetical protein
MTEADWLACTDPDPMLKFIGGKASDRKLRLFTTACIRIRQGGVAFGEDDPVVVMEAYADGMGTAEEVDGAWQAPWSDALAEAARVSRGCQRRRAWPGGTEVKMSAAQASLMRCIFGNPFRPLSLDPAVLAWNDATVARLAQAAYDERDMPSGLLDNARLAVLADALEEAGCQDQDILGHCRSGGEHVRGCWVVDLLLGKS